MLPKTTAGNHPNTVYVMKQGTHIQLQLVSVNDVIYVMLSLKTCLLVTLDGTALGLIDMLQKKSD